MKHLREHYCVLHRSGGKHDILINTVTQKKTTVPRHPDIDDNLCALICQQLSIAKP